MIEQSLLDTTTNFHNRDYRDWAKAELVDLIGDFELLRYKWDTLQPAFDAIARILEVGVTLLQGSSNNAYFADYLSELRVCETFNVAETPFDDRMRGYASILTTILIHSACQARLPKMVAHIPVLRMTLYEAILWFVAQDPLGDLRMMHALQTVGEAFLYAQGPELLQAIRSLTNFIRPATSDHLLPTSDAFSLYSISAAACSMQKRHLSATERERRIVSALKHLCRKQKSELAKPAFDLADVELMSQGIAQLATALQRVRAAKTHPVRSVQAMIEPARALELQADSMLH